jgi:hypothetical protein
MKVYEYIDGVPYVDVTEKYIKLWEKKI